jgi:hypothetical protein
VNPFWADEEVEMARQLACGVDGMLTNYPALPALDADVIQTPLITVHFISDSPYKT